MAKKIIIAILGLVLFLSMYLNFTLLFKIDRNIQTIGTLNIMIIELNKEILKRQKGKWI